jgi:hypothetical protein
VDYQIGVVAHVKRQKQMNHLSETIHPELIEPDDGTLGAGGNHLATLMALRRKNPAAWAVVLEDDAQPVDGFREQVNAALQVAPSDVVSFYIGTGYPAQYQGAFTEALKMDVCWLLHPQLRHGVAYAISPGVQRALMIRMEKLISQRYAPDDAIGRWCMENRTPVAYTNPSLVDHEDGPTVVDYRYHLGHVSSPGRNRPRKAHKVGTRVTWSDSSVIVGAR